MVDSETVDQQGLDMQRYKPGKKKEGIEAKRTRVIGQQNKNY